MISGDQFHDTLHNTRVRREIAANERHAFLEKSRQDMVLLAGRYDAALFEIEQKRRTGTDCFDKAKDDLHHFRKEAEMALQRIADTDDEGWYDLRDDFHGWLEKLREEIRAIEVLST